ncbi:MAG: hypothetical protein R8K54_06625 [Mariprofundaceae bacterium]
MEFTLLYSVGAIILYFLADWILNRIEIARGERFEYRGLIFFAIIFTLALGYMSMLNTPPQ